MKALLTIPLACLMLSAKANVTDVRVPETVMIEGGTTLPDPSLLEEKVDDEVLRRMREELQKLGAMAIDNIEPAKLSLPDYEIAKEVTRHLMKRSIVNYFQSLEQIKAEIIRTMSELLALKKLADRESDKNGLLTQEYHKDLKLKIPKLNDRINKIYGEAVMNLYSLQGMGTLPVSKLKNRRPVKDPFKENRRFSFEHGLWGICSTSLCMKMLLVDLENWHRFARSFNQKVSFTNLGTAKKISTQDNLEASPLVTIAMIDAAKDLLKIGLEKNKEYSIPGIIAKAGLDIVKAPAGVGVLLLSVPVYAFERVSSALNRLDVKVMHLELALNPKKTYSSKAVINGSRRNVQEYSKHLNSAIYVSEGQSSSNMRKSFNEAYEKGLRIAPQFVESISYKQLLHLEKEGFIDLSYFLPLLPKEKLEVLKKDLKGEELDLLEMNNAERFPESINSLRDDLVISLILSSRSPSKFINALMKNEERLNGLSKKSPEILSRLGFLSVNDPMAAHMLESKWCTSDDCEESAVFRAVGERLMVDVVWESNSRYGKLPVTYSAPVLKGENNTLNIHLPNGRSWTWVYNSEYFSTFMQNYSPEVYRFPLK